MFLTRRVKKAKLLSSARADRRREALERVVRLYEVWDKIKPGKGYDAKAAEWKTELEPTSLPFEGPP